ncbi:MAG: FkbM family methyltransferase [Magnetococcales bacterium]|nr:FkbM family methyltransferase [Magnetococcales bacterium]
MGFLKRLQHNIRSTCEVCPHWLDRLKYLLSLYGSRHPWMATLLGSTVCAAFNYPPPIGPLRLTFRNNQGSDLYILGEVFHHQFYTLPPSCAPETILDLGANIGLTMVYFSRVYPRARLAGVEPIPGNMSLLQKNIIDNQIVATIFQSAVAVEDGHVEMEIALRDYDHRILEETTPGRFTGQTLRVESMTMDSILERLQWARIGLLKIDIEGYEKVLLKRNCAWLTRVDALCIECHAGFGEEDLLDISRSWGFAKPQLLKGIWLLVRT